MKTRLSSLLALTVVLAAGSGLAATGADPSSQTLPGAKATTDSGNFSAPVREVLKLAHSGASDDVIVAYIANSTAVYNLSAGEVIQLKDAGLSSAVTTAMLRHDLMMRDRVTTPPVATMPAATGVATAADDNVGSAQAAGNYYDALSPYGSWYDLPGYGWCWQPTQVVTDTDWAPYCDGGDWLYCDDGWYWNSIYPWGWAPFHYGRWWCDPARGWLWFPGRVWAPCWVTWRSFGDYCGWAPLGIGIEGRFGFGLRDRDFTFVNRRDFGARNLADARIGRAEVHGFFDRSTTVNHGFDFKGIAGVSRTPINRVDMRNVSSPANARFTANETAMGRGTVGVFRPEQAVRSDFTITGVSAASRSHVLAPASGYGGASVFGSPRYNASVGAGSGFTSRAQGGFSTFAPSRPQQSFSPRLGSGSWGGSAGRSYSAPAPRSPGYASHSSGGFSGGGGHGSGGFSGWHGRGR